MVQDSPSRKQDQFIVRLPDGMRDRIKHASETNNRSMNAEIVATLEEKYPAPSPTSYMELLKMTVSFLHSMDMSAKTVQETEELIAKIGDMPIDDREEVSRIIASDIIKGLDKKVADYKAEHPTPTKNP